MDDKVVKIPHDLYQKAKDMAQTEGITIAESIAKLVETGWSQPSVCELVQFRKVLEARGITPPKRADWVWGITNILPAAMLAGTKLEPYAEARQEAELTCSIADELHSKLVGERGSVEPEITEPVAEATEQTKSETSFIADAGGEDLASPPAEAETPAQEPAELKEEQENAN